LHIFLWQHIVLTYCRDL